MARVKKRVTARKWQGDDRYSWAVFLDGRPQYTGLSKGQVKHYTQILADLHSLKKGEY